MSPRLAALPLPNGRFVVVLSGIGDVKDEQKPTPEAAAAFNAATGAAAFVVFDYAIEVQG